MNSERFIADFTEWIKIHTTIEALYIDGDREKPVLYALTSNKSLFLRNFMIFSDYERTTYCKLFNFNDVPYLEIEFKSGNKAVIEFISEDFPLGEDMVCVYGRR